MRGRQATRQGPDSNQHPMYPPGQNSRSALLEWSVAVLGAAASVFFASQVHLNALDKERLQGGYEEARLNVAKLTGTAKQWEESYQKREIYLQKIDAQEAQLTAFLNGLLELSKTDPDARALVYRHKVGGDVVLPEAGQPKTPPPAPAQQKAPEPAPTKSKPSGGAR